jgi:hypothetical protein
MNRIISKLTVNLNGLIFLIIFMLFLENQGVAKIPETLDEKIGQLLIIPACQLRGKDH